MTPKDRVLELIRSGAWLDINDLLNGLEDAITAETDKFKPLVQAARALLSAKSGDSYHEAMQALQAALDGLQEGERNGSN